MTKDLHADEFDGMTFGMAVDTSGQAWKNFKKSVKIEKCISIFGDEINRLVVPYLMLGAIMQGAHWLVTERMCFDEIHIDGFCAGEGIYVRYTDEPIDFRNRQAFRKEVEEND